MKATFLKNTMFTSVVLFSMTAWPLAYASQDQADQTANQADQANQAQNAEQITQNLAQYFQDVETLSFDVEALTQQSVAGNAQQLTQDVATVKIQYPNKLKIDEEGAAARSAIYDGEKFTILNVETGKYSVIPEAGADVNELMQNLKAQGLATPLAVVIQQNLSKKFVDNAADVKYMGELKMDQATVQGVSLNKDDMDMLVMLDKDSKDLKRVILSVKMANGKDKKQLVLSHFVKNQAIDASMFNVTLPQGAVQVPIKAEPVGSQEPAQAGQEPAQAGQAALQGTQQGANVGTESVAVANHPQGLWNSTGDTLTTEALYPRVGYHGRYPGSYGRYPYYGGNYYGRYPYGYPGYNPWPRVYPVYPVYPLNPYYPYRYCWGGRCY